MSVKLAHPREFISEKVAVQLANSALNAEQSKFLDDEQWSVIMKENWLNMYVPRTFGGLELSLPEIIRMEEGIAWADGSTGWVVTLCSGAAWFIGFLNPELAANIFKSNQACFAGSGAINGTADRSVDKYAINGYWPFATGLLKASVFTLNCLVKENGDQVYDSMGKPVVKSFLLWPDEVEIHRTWNAMGMVATASHSFEVRNIVVPENRCFNIDPNYSVLPQIIFRFPFLQLAESTLTINLSGMACKFVDLVEAKLSAKSANLSAQIVDPIRAKLDKARNNFYYFTDQAWDSLAVGGSISDNFLAEVTDSSSQLAFCCSEVINTLYPFCGLEAADKRNEINRVWRNFNTAVQHNIFRGFRMRSLHWE